MCKNGLDTNMMVCTHRKMEESISAYAGYVITSSMWFLLAYKQLQQVRRWRRIISVGVTR